MPRALSIPVILDTTRQGRKSAHVARLVVDMLSRMDKVIQVSGAEASGDSAFGGPVDEAHTCPGCGKNATRAAKVGNLRES